MRAVFLKSWFVYKKQPFEVISMIIRSIIILVPFMVLATMSGNVGNSSFTMVSFLAASFFTNVIMGCSFEFYLDLVSGKISEFKIANVSMSKYTFSMLIIYAFLSLLELTISGALLVNLFPIEIKWTAIRVGQLLILLPAIAFLLFSMSCIGTSLTYKTGKFSMIGLVLNVIFLFSGFYSPSTISIFNNIINLTPFRSLIVLIRNILLDEKLFYQKSLQIIILYIGALVLFIFGQFLVRYLERKLL